MSDDSIQLVTIALQLIETVMRNEKVEINVITYPESVQAYDADNKGDIAVVERKYADE